MHSIPVALRRLVKRLEKVDDLSRQDLTSVLFVVRLGDSLHRDFYGSFLTLSLIEELCVKLGIPDLVLEIDMFTTRWNFRQGTVMVAHRIVFDYDMESVSVLSKIGWSVLEGTMSSKEGLHLIREHEINMERKRPEWWYREFPGRSLVILLMGSTCATVYFGGTWYDLGFAAISGLAGGLVAWAATWHELWLSVADYLAAILTAMIAVASIGAFPTSTCFSAQVLGTLYWFMYGTAYVLAIYEITNNQVIVGVTRFFVAIMRSYGLAFGVLLGVWFSAYDDDRFQEMDRECSKKDSQISDIWYLLLFPLSAIASLMQFRVKLGHFVVCLVVQTVAYGSQYLIGTVWEQPEFFANLVPAFLATIASQVCILVAQRLKVSGLQIRRDAYLAKKTDGDEVTVMSGDGQNGHANGTHNGADSDQIIYLAEKQAGGYTLPDRLSYARSDLWFCLLPALYLLVPGSKLLKGAFVSFISRVEESIEANDLASSLLIIGLGQVVGLRLGFATLWVCSDAWALVVDRHCGKGPQLQDNSKSRPSPTVPLASSTWTLTPTNEESNRHFGWRDNGDDKENGDDFALGHSALASP